MPDVGPGLITIFGEALEQSDPVARATYLDRTCGGDTALRQQVEVLLAAHGRAGRFLEPDPAQVANAAGRFDPEVTRTVGQATGDCKPDGTTVPFGNNPAGEERSTAIHQGMVIAGRFRLLEIIGEGGMGTVYLAEQSEPVKRQVALKLIKTGMDSRTVLNRFDAERQALAMMDHPNIARIYDGGVTPSGQPFFVMELVHGLSITQYCDEHRLPIPARLDLFVSVCHAVQHAHQKGIIHRDLKPGNVLVTEVDGRPMPKVIDFGVAKATEQKLTDQSFADTGVIVGTPEYMSPEQADPSSMDIDTRTDVYALGVLLYELLVGSTPIDAKSFKRGAILEMLRMVREVDPPRPSTKLSTAEALPNIAANRGIDPTKLAKFLSGELDWLVMKAIDKDRTRRYETANGLARDIQRYLSDEVVEARPPSAGYRLKKFVRRNKGRVIAASLVLMALIGGMVSTSIGMAQAVNARQAASERAEGERLAKLDAVSQTEQAQKRLTQIEKANEILGSIFENLNPKEIAKAERPLQAILVEKLDQAVAQLEGESIGDPLVVAAMQVKFGDSLMGLGEPGKAIVLLVKARATRQAKLGPEHPDTLASMSSLAWAYLEDGQLDLTLPLHEETLKLRKATLGPEHLSTLISMNNLAAAYYTAGKRDLALQLYVETLKLLKAKLGPEHPDTLASMDGLAVAYRAAGKLELALPLFEENLKLHIAKLGPEHPDTLASRGNLAAAYRAAGKLDQALPLFVETLKLRNAKLGPEHPQTLVSMNDLAVAYQDSGKRDVALTLFEETLKLRRAKLGTEHLLTIQSLSNLAAAYRAAGKLDQALPLFVETLKLRKAKLGPEHPSTLTSMNNLAAAYWSAKQLDKSIPLFEETVTRFEVKLGRDHPETLLAVGNLGANYLDAGRLAEAIPLLEEAHRAAQKFRSLRVFRTPLRDAYMKAGESAKLINLLKEQLSEARKELPKDSPQLAGSLAQIGSSLLEQKQWTEAELLLRESVAIREKTQPDVWTTFSTKSLLGGALLGRKKYADAEPLLRAGYEGMKQREKTIPAGGRTRIPEALDRLIELNTATNKPDEVNKWQAERAKYSSVAPKPAEKK